MSTRWMAALPLLAAGCSALFPFDYERVRDAGPDADAGPGACTDVVRDCDGDPDNGCETDTTSDPAHCGGCGMACGVGGVCADAVCDEVAEVALGDAHSCARLASGAVSCWGRNEVEQIDSTGRAAAVPVPIALRSAAVSLDTGTRHACAILDDGSVFCWGDNSWGQLGTGMDRPESGPVQVGYAFVEPRQVAAGDGHTCVLDGDGVSCWGANGLGQLGRGDATDDFDPGLVSGLGVSAESIASLHASEHSTCVRVDDGSVWCWGYNEYVQLGLGHTTNAATPSRLTLAGASQISVGGWHACAVLEGGELFCWGDGGEGQLGWGAGGMEVSPRRVGRFGADMNVTDVVSVAAGDAHTCARRSGGSVWCWGAALDGRLAIDPPPGESDIPTDTGVVAERIVLGGGHGCALGEAGLSCWGRNDHGQVGVGDPLYFSRPRLVEGNAVDTTSDRPLALGDYHTCNVATTGRGAVCFGRGIDAQLGQGEWESSSRPVVVAAGTAAAVISSEDDHTCVLDASGRASCWGPNYLGQLGDGTTTDSASPRPVSAAPTFAQIDVGERHTCAVTDEGVVWCWGSNVGGQLGTGTSDPSPHPVPQAIVGIRADHVAAADDFTCALASSELYCWGHPDARIGRGGSDPYLPTLVDGIDAASMLWVGDQTGCVLNGGALQCWGLNDEGQLGALPDPVPVPEPLALPAGLTSVESVAIGEGHLCVLSGGGELACLGRNDAGQLGGGTFDDPGATRVDLARVQHVAAGWRHTCAVLEAGELHCWGSDLDGRLGSGRDLAVVPPRPVAWADP